MTTRTAAISDLRDRFARDGYPRLTMCVILALAGAVAFLSSVAALRAGVASMGFRYGLAVLAGCVAVLVPMRGWITLHRGEWSHGLDALDPTPALERGGGATDKIARVERRREDSSVFFVCMSAAGFALQRIVPSAHSIGGVVRAFVK